MTDLLKDRIIVVTGGSGLLGSEYLKAIKQAGGIGINADISSQDNLDAGQIKLDIASEESVEKVIKSITDKYGRIDGWVNNAYPRTADWSTPFEQVPFASWQKNVDMHLNGYFLCCQRVLETMKKQGSGAVINLGSIYGILGPDFTIYEGSGIRNIAGYAAIKGGIINLTRYMAAYYAPHGVRVNSISPGGIFDNQDPVFVKNYEHKVPMKRMGRPSDIAPSVVFLLSDWAGYITGHNLVVDGGWSIV